MPTDVLIRSFDSANSGANTNETVLTPTAIKTRGITKLRTLQVPDDPRLEAQPLYVSGIGIKGKVRDVVYQATMGNTVFAWDVDTGEMMWRTNLGTAINGTKDIDVHTTNIKWGILSTPVIDRANNVLYTCAWISPDHSGNWKTGQHIVAALDLVTGALKPGKTPLNLHGSTYDPGPGGTVQQFDSSERKQRAALTMVDGAVIVCFGTIMELGSLARGWMFAIDTVNWSIAATWSSTANESGGGIWMSGAAPAIQTDGSIWIVTGNGAFDGKVDFGESVVRLKYSPPKPGAKGSLKVTGWWTPWTDKGRTGGDPEGEGHTAAEMAILKKLPKASSFRKLIHIARMGMPIKNSDWDDQDLGASGIALIESQGIALVSGKDGILYTIKIGAPGDTAPNDLFPDNAAKNYAKLATPPILYTYFAPTIDPAPKDPTALNQWAMNVTHHLHGTPIVWQSTAHGQMHFCGGENGNLRAWHLNTDDSSAYLGCSSAYASPQAVGPQEPHGGMPGWGIALSANGKADGVIWGLIPYGDANMEVTNSRLLAYDAANFAAFSDGSGEIVPLWDSQDWNWSFSHPKFNRPIIAAGKVIVPTYDGRLLVLGLA